MADIRITGRMVNFSRLTFDTNDHDAIRQQLTSTLNEGSYLGTLVILDSTVEQELIALIQLLIDIGLQPMAVIDGILGDEARAIQFPVLPADQPYSGSKHLKNKSSNMLSKNQQIRLQRNTTKSYIKSAYHLIS